MNVKSQALKPSYEEQRSSCGSHIDVLEERAGDVKYEISKLP